MWGNRCRQELDDPSVLKEPDLGGPLLDKQETSTIIAFFSVDRPTRHDLQGC